MRDGERQLLAQLVGLYGAAAVAKEARAIERPPRKRGPRPVEANCHAVWLAVEVRRDRGDGRRPLSVTNACNFIRQDLKKLLSRRPVGVQRLRQMHTESIAQQKRQPDLAERLAQRVSELRQTRDAWPGLMILPYMFKFVGADEQAGPLVDKDAAQALGGALFVGHLIPGKFLAAHAPPSNSGRK